MCRVFWMLRLRIRVIWSNWYKNGSGVTMWHRLRVYLVEDEPMYACSHRCSNINDSFLINKITTQQILSKCRKKLWVCWMRVCRSSYHRNRHCWCLSFTNRFFFEHLVQKFWDSVIIYCVRQSISIDDSQFYLC